jgi:RimJ/RimL family protein N-acetyltransferase
VAVNTVTLASGRKVAIRPIRPDDGPRLRAAYDRLSSQSKYSRFLAAKPHLTSADVRFLVCVDGRDHVALVATPIGDQDRIVGVGRFVRLDEDSQMGELAVTVADAFQHDGLGSFLLARLADAAAELGIRRFKGTMLSDNHAARRLVRRAAAGAVLERNRGYLREIQIELAP